jgi:Ser/Thr protein kinase RdoA (MazF antagonist)
MSTTLSGAELLVAPAPQVTDDHAVAIARDGFGLTVLELCPLSAERDRNFFVRTSEQKLMLKIVHPLEAPEVTDLQIAVLAHLAEHSPSIPVPRERSIAGGRPPPYRFRHPDGTALAARCWSWIDGSPLAAMPATAARSRAVATMLARLDLALSDFRRRGDDRRLLWDAHRADACAPLLDEIDDTRLRALAGAALQRLTSNVRPREPELPRQLIHNDFNPQNLLLDRADRVAGVIDFGDIVRAPRVQDLATAAAYCAGGHDDYAEAIADLAEAYHDVARLTGPETDVLLDLVAARLALSAIVSSWHAAAHPENRDYTLRNQAIVISNLERLMEIPPMAGRDRLRLRLGVTP